MDPKSTCSIQEYLHRWLFGFFFTVLKWPVRVDVKSQKLHLLGFSPLCMFIPKIERWQSYTNCIYLDSLLCDFFCTCLQVFFFRCSKITLVTAAELFWSWSHEDNNFQFLNKCEGVQWCWSWLWWVGVWWLRWWQWQWPLCGNVESRKIVMNNREQSWGYAPSVSSFIQIRGNCQKIKYNILKLLFSSKCCGGTHCPCPQHSPRAHIMHKQCIKKHNSWGG